MQSYQLDYLISPETPEQDIKNLEEKIKSLIGKEEGSVAKTESPFKKILAYKVRNFQEAFLAGLTFDLSEEKLGLLEKELKANKSIIRYLIIKKPPEAKMKPRAHRPLQIKPREQKDRAKVELKEIEKKLEEILGE